VRGEHTSWDALEAAITALDEAGHEGLAMQLLGLTAAVAREAVARPSFAKALSSACSPPAVNETSKADPARSDRASGRRTAPVLDPFVVHREVGANGLRQRLSQLTVEQLKDIVAEHGMDRDKLAMKWKTPDRLIERITTTVVSRAQKGDVFRR
jgi:hypothetical protein